MIVRGAKERPCIPCDMKEWSSTFSSEKRKKVPPAAADFVRQPRNAYEAGYDETAANHPSALNCCMLTNICGPEATETQQTQPSEIAHSPRQSAHTSYTSILYREDIQYSARHERPNVPSATPPSCTTGSDGARSSCERSLRSAHQRTA